MLRLLRVRPRAPTAAAAALSAPLRVSALAPAPAPTLGPFAPAPALALARRALAVKAPKPPPAKEVPKPPATAAALKIAAGSRRTGVFGIKVGMLRMFDAWGVATPVTVVKLEGAVVVDHKTVQRDGYTAVVVGAGPVKRKKMRAAQMGLFRVQRVEPRRKLKEFRVTPDALPPVGAAITAQHFCPGQKVDVSGTTIGKGFQGAVKRWGFKGQPRTHGMSRSHRSLGGTGARQDPGKTWKGKKMHGKMGNKRRTVQSVVVFGVDPVRDLVFLKGHVPGHAGNVVELRDAIRVPQQFEKERLDVPFPTFAGPRPSKPASEPTSPADWILIPKGVKDPLLPPAA